MDIGVDERLPCVENGIHLLESASGEAAVHVSRTQFASDLEVEALSAASEAASGLIEEIRREIAAANVYRHKILSLECDAEQWGGSGHANVRFHRFPDVRREDTYDFVAGGLGLFSRRRFNSLIDLKTSASTIADIANPITDDQTGCLFTFDNARAVAIVPRATKPIIRQTIWGWDSSLSGLVGRRGIKMPPTVTTFLSGDFRVGQEEKLGRASIQIRLASPFVSPGGALAYASG